MQEDHLLLTPSATDAGQNLIYNAQYAIPGLLNISVCNPMNADFNDGTTHFNLLAIDAE